MVSANTSKSRLGRESAHERTRNSSWRLLSSFASSDRGLVVPGEGLQGYAVLAGAFGEASAIESDLDLVF